MAVDPNSWQALFSPTTSKELAGKPHRTFTNQLVQYLTNGFSPGNLAQQVSGSNRGIKAGALKNFSVDIPAGTGTMTQDVRDSYAVYVSIEITGTSPVLVLKNLLTGSPVSLAITNNAGAARTFFINATNGNNVAYTIFAKTTGSYTNMVGAGVSIGSGTTFVFSGNSSLKGVTPDLELVYC
jgi:hypothetical protein